MSIAAGSAVAAAQSSVSVKGPHTVPKAGGQVKLRFSGYAAPGVNRLQVWLDDHACATTASSENGRSGLHSPTNFHVQGNFRDQLTVEHTSPGRHVVCAYLVSRSSGATAARASWRYVTS